ncbi:putative ribonuclease H-like domain-containing protein [Tanacetum coccineum]
MLLSPQHAEFGDLKVMSLIMSPKPVDHTFGDPQVALKDIGIFYSGCSRHMTGNKSYLTDYQDYDGGFVAFAGSSKGGKIKGKGKIRSGNLDFEDVYFVKELKFNLFSVSQMCDKKNSVLFTETKCLILSPEFKLPDENQVMLKIPRKDNMYSFDLKNIVPSKGLTCLIAKATNDESKLWHRRLGHLNFKTLNKLVKGNLVRGLPSKTFENDHTCVACQKGKQHKATCKSKLVNTFSQPLQILHMNLFGPTFVKSIMGKMYCLVLTDDYSRFSWVFFLAKTNKTSAILKNFITGIENQLNHKVKVIRCDNGTEFKNYEMNQFYGIKGIKREFNNARTLQQNGVAERKNRTLIEAARTMLADSLLPIPFWAEAVNTACYVHNRVLVTKPHNKTPYELLLGRTPIVSFMRPFSCLVTILNTLDHLGKFDGKANEGTTTVKTVNTGEQKLIATVDGHKFTITEASVRRHLHIADEDGISSLPNTKTFEQLTLMGYGEECRTYVAPTLTNKLFSNMKIGFTRVHVPLFENMFIHDQVGQGEGPTHSIESQHTPTASPTTSQLTASHRTSSPEQPTQKPTSEPITTHTSLPVTKLQIPQSTSSMPHDSPLFGGYILGSVEGSLKLNELTDLCTKLVERVTTLETELTQTKQVYGKAIKKLVKKVKHLED